MKLKKLLGTLSVMMFTFSFSMSNSVAVHANDNNTWDFSYTGAVQTFTVPYSGKYKLKVWGAQGGTANFGGELGGKGGYAYGQIMATKGQVLYVYVGEQGFLGSGGWNGGGSGGSGASYGGGASDIRTVSGNWNDLSGLKSRIIVAGGGGGAERTNGGDGGGLVGGVCPGLYYNVTQLATGGTQTSGGLSGISQNYGIAQDGGFGYGGNGFSSETQDAAGGGGGGWYGGGGVTYATGGGGGSAYIGGVLHGYTVSGVNSGNGRAKIMYVPNYANGIAISKRSDDLVVGQTDKLTALVIPDDASVKTVKWTSSDPSVATVDDNGNIAAVKAGIAIITATVQDGRNLHGQCRVCVTK